MDYPTLPTTAIIYWIFYFYSGVIFAHYKDPIRNVCIQWKYIIVILVMIFLALVLFEYIYRSYNNPIPDYYNHFNRHSIVVYVLMVWFLFVSFDENINKFLVRYSSFRRIVGCGTMLSFSVYIFHTWNLRLLEMTPLSLNLFGIISSLLMFSFGSMYIISLLVPKPQFLRLVLGLPSKFLK